MCDVRFKTSHNLGVAKLEIVTISGLPGGCTVTIDVVPCIHKAFVTLCAVGVADEES